MEKLEEAEKFLNFFPITAKKTAELRQLAEKEVREEDLELARKVAQRWKDLVGVMKELTVTESVHFTIAFIKAISQS